MNFIDGRTTEAGLRALKEAVNAEHNPVIYLAIDPGKSNGICGFDNRCYVQFMYTIHEGDILEFLEIFERVTTVVIENFKLYPNKATAQFYSEMLTPKVIDRVDYWASKNEVQVFKQMSSIKDTGYKWAGKKPLPKSNPLNHQLDAYIHFVYWAVKNGKMKPESLLK